MKLDKVQLIYFSASGNTRRVARQVAQGTGLPVQEWNVTSQRAKVDFQPDEQTLTILASPSFGGMAPKPFLEKLTQMQGKGPAILVATYGAKGIEDILAEMMEAASQQGYWVIGAAIFVARYSLAPEIAPDRPNVEDLNQAEQFGVKMFEIASKLRYGQQIRFVLPGSRPYHRYEGPGISPRTNHACVECGRCADACPVGAIPEEHPNKTDATKCIGCMRCVYICPCKARSIKGLKAWRLRHILKRKCDATRPNTFWVPYLEEGPSSGLG